MEWMILLQQIFEVCIVPLLGVLTCYIVNYIKAKTAELNTNNSNELLTKYLTMLSDTVCDCVIATNQTYVEALKNKNAFDAEAQKIAFEMTYNAVIKVLSSTTACSVTLTVLKKAPSAPVITTASTTAASTSARASAPSYRTAKTRLPPNLARSVWMT